MRTRYKTIPAIVILVLVLVLVLVSLAFAGCVKSKYKTRSFMSEEELKKVDEVYNPPVEEGSETTPEPEIEPFLEEFDGDYVMTVNGHNVSKDDVMLLYEYLAKLGEQDAKYNKIRACREMIRVYACMTQWPDTIDTTQRTLNELKESTKNGVSLGSLIKENSQEPGVSESDGKLTGVGRGQLSLPFEARAFEAEVGEIVGPFATEFGWHLLEVLARNDDPEAPTIDVQHLLLVHGLNPDNLTQIREKMQIWQSQVQVVLLADELKELMPEYVRPEVAEPAGTAE